MLILEGILALSKVPLDILDALIPVIFVPNPENEYDVVIPVTFKLVLTVAIPLTYKSLPIITSPSLVIPTPPVLIPT